jgi:hypothetical protein
VENALYGIFHTNGTKIEDRAHLARDVNSYVIPTLDGQRLRSFGRLAANSDSGSDSVTPPNSPGNSPTNRTLRRAALSSSSRRAGGHGSAHHKPAQLIYRWLHASTLPRCDTIITPE